VLYVYVELFGTHEHCGFLKINCETAIIGRKLIIIFYYNLMVTLIDKWQLNKYVVLKQHFILRGLKQHLKENGTETIKDEYGW